MERDQPQDPRKPSRPNPDQPREPRRRSRLPLAWILLALYAIIKKPKWLIPIVIVLGIFFVVRSYYLDYAEGTGPFEYSAGTDAFSFGAELNEGEYDKALVYESLAVGSAGLPRSVDLQSFAPSVLHQGRQGSCSGWASAYGARTISYAQAQGQDPDQIAFSPSFLYNQIALPRCQGALLRDAMEAMKNIGSVPFRSFGYTDQTCQILPEPEHRGEASQYRIKGYTRLSQGASNYGTDIQAVKQHLAQGAPVVIGMLVGQSFQRNMLGRRIWTPTSSDYRGTGLGGHAMCLVGYDDQVAGGAFQVMNSWGTQWGEGGYAWIRYNDFSQFVREAYGLYPEGRTKQYDADRVQVRFALVDNQSQQVIPLRQTEEIVFRTSRPMRKGSKFKLAITNSVECYTYIFGMETNGSSYVLFPYTQKHSAYCGITGTRLFPRDYSMTPDDVGSRDYIALVVSKKPLDYHAVNRKINSSRNPSYMMRMVESLVDDFVPECDFDVDGSVSFDCQTRQKNVLGMIIEIDKI